MNKGLSRKITRLHSEELSPVELTEVSNNVIDFDSKADAARFLGIQSSTLNVYVTAKIKIIRSKVDGKLYLIKRKTGKS
jgi:hypothetical protein